MRALFGALLVGFVLALVASAPAMAQTVVGPERIEVAQKRTLFDILFGRKETKPPERTITRTPTRRSPAPAIAPRIIVPQIIDKNENATRLAVFGDSMAIDLARALERAYRDDPNLAVLGFGVGSSGFVRNDFFDWNAELAKQIASNSFDLALIIIGINDRQKINGAAPLSEAWKSNYRQRLDEFLRQLRQANKPAIWVGLPPMRAPTYSAAISKISSLQMLASVAGGAEFVDIYERFIGQGGRFSSSGPDLSGQIVTMRKSDGIHFSNAGSDKLVFFIKQALRRYYRAGSVSIKIADPLEGTDGQNMVRPPFQGNGQIRLLEVAGAVAPLSIDAERADQLINADTLKQSRSRFDLLKMVDAPVGRADAFGVGMDSEINDPDTAPSATP
ncbi:hypothetical protein MNBD_ALPHA12-1546 [hydrothermal vent metagenome]|uniref:Uncharacterized protein n=1 Tax=hydrothermal vent metagenome TaxID=652676 RepID=A0A3B0TU39_9ZZZZ